MKWIALCLALMAQGTGQDNLTLYNEGRKVVSVNWYEFTLPHFPEMPFADQDKVEFFMNEMEEQVYREPVNAKIGNGGEVVPEKAGYTLDKRAFIELLNTYYYGRKPLSIQVPRKVVYPRVDSELLSQISTKVIGQYVTFFNAKNKERSHNISLAAEAINNQVVFPGETFSFNKTVGKRTAAKGYLPAPIIVKGELSEGIGGGICQVSSTLFNAVDRAGVKIVERYTHSKQVQYVPPGRDATVSWYGPDFSFQNNYNQPILIRAKKVGGQLAVIVYSSEDVNIHPRTTPGASSRIPDEIEDGAVHTGPDQS